MRLAGFGILSPVSPSAAFIQSDFGRYIVTDLILQMRSLRPNGWTKHLDIPSNGIMHTPNNLNRNLAMLRLCNQNGGAPIGRDWVGVSGTKDFFPPKGVKAHVLKSRKGDFCVNMKGLYDLKRDIFEAPLYRPVSTALECSEVPLLNALAKMIPRLGVTAGDLVFITERLPCASCTKLLNRFYRRFPRLNIHLLLMFDFEGRTESRLSKKAFDFVAGSTYLVEYVEPDDNGFVKSFGPAFAHGGSGFGSRNSDGIHLAYLSSSGGPVMATPENPADTPSRAPGSPSAHWSARIRGYRFTL